MTELTTETNDQIIQESKPLTIRGRIRRRIQDLEQTAAEQAAQIAQERDRCLRLAAEFDNYRKRTAAEFRALQESAGERIMSALLPVMDDFERLINHNTANIDLTALQQGVKLIQQKLAGVLQREGLITIEALNKPFDPALQEAVAELDDADNPPGTVVVEIEKGYKLGPKIIRHAKVAVSRTPVQPEADENG
ncbi:MAG: nucleotide exchange factor GrpE [Calditrichaeota bacterium]|nr:nucleotide exchange factor GrpE [Calditrichota bacterium]